MQINQNNYFQITQQLQEKKVVLVAVSKTKPVEAIKELYDLGHRDFGENYVQELVEKAGLLPKDIRWHFIGHLQSNKVKQIVPFIYLIHGIDSLKLLQEVNKQAGRFNRVLRVLLQVHIAEEETKFGFDKKELHAVFSAGALQSLNHVEVAGLMGMASFTDDMARIRKEFQVLKSLFERYRLPPDVPYQLQVLSMGMSSDYHIALEKGTTMVRIGSLLFGERSKTA